MPRANASRATTSRPYDRRSLTASPAQSDKPPASPIQVAHEDPDRDRDEDDPDPPSDVPGLPTYAEYKRIEAGYLHSLSPRKRDKALITQAMFDKIWDVLHQPDACTIETPQFRFWVRKMFSLSRPVPRGGSGCGAATHPVPNSDADTHADLALERSLGIGLDRSSADVLALAHASVVLHENRPVAIMEQLYALFCFCHVRAGHGGRDKTCAVIREHYAWVPKELTAQFVKACPTCVLKRSGHGHGVGLGLGLDVGVLAYTGARVVGHGRKKGGAERDDGSAAGWPTTGGPLDPANPEPCGIRERLGSRSTTSPVGRSPPRVVPVVDHVRRDEIGLSATNPDLPPLTSTLSNESLDANVNPPYPTPSEVQQKPKPHDSDEAECRLPPALRPLRLLGPVASDSDAPDSLAQGVSASYTMPFQIDPVLLSFNYPGMDPSLDPDPESDAQGTSESPRPYVRLRGPAMTETPGTILDRMWNLPALVPSYACDSPDSSFERSSYPTSVLSLSMEFMERDSQCGSRGPFDMLYHPGCSVDEVGQDLVDGSLSFSTPMTEAL